MPPSKMPPRDWNIQAVRAPQALAQLGAGDIWGDVDVAHIDTGVTPHPALGAWVQIDKGVNYLEPGAKPIDPLSGFNGGHGTKTCSVLCGLDSAGAGFTGAAPKLPTIPYRVVDNVVLETKRERSNIAKAIRHAVDENLCEVVTISLGFPSAIFGHHEFGGAIDYAYERGVIVVAAGGQKVNKACYPGKFYRAIGVGGYEGDAKGDPAGMYQDYDQMNGFIDIWAPAKPILRGQPCPGTPGSPKCYAADGDGTSYATPLVAAAAAMWLVMRGPELTMKYGANLWMRTEAFRVCLKLAAQDLSGLSDFARIKPPLRVSAIEPKGSATLSPTTGGLDIVSLLAQPLPDPADLKQGWPAAGQFA